jgi:hypothetical protein
MRNERKLPANTVVPSVKLILHFNFLFFNFCAEKLKIEGKKLVPVLN